MSTLTVTPQQFAEYIRKLFADVPHDEKGEFDREGFNRSVVLGTYKFADSYKDEKAARVALGQAVYLMKRDLKHPDDKELIDGFFNGTFSTAIRMWFNNAEIIAMHDDIKYFQLTLTPEQH